MMEDASRAGQRDAGGSCHIPAQGDRMMPSCDMLLYEFKAGINAYLAPLGPEVPARSLAALIEFNERNRDREMPYLAGAVSPGSSQPVSRIGLIGERWRRVGQSREGMDAAFSQTPIGRLCRAHQPDHLGHRPAERRPLHWRQQLAGGRRRLPHQPFPPASSVGISFVEDPAAGRGGSHQARACVRAGDQPRAIAGLPADDVRPRTHSTMPSTDKVGCQPGHRLRLGPAEL